MVTMMTSSRRDGGYGWVIVLAFFLTSMIVDGIRYSFGVLFVELLNEFDSGKGETALIGSILVAVYNLCGPIFAVIVIKLGCRKACFLGSGITCIGFISTYFSTKLFHLYFTYGLFLGFGYGLLYLAGTVSIGRYFYRRRAIALGLSNCGSGFGQFAFTPLFNLFIAQYTWRGAMLICAGISLNCCVFGSLYRPFKSETPNEIEAAVNSKGSGGADDENIDNDNDQVTPMLVKKCISVDENGKLDEIEHNGGPIDNFENKFEKTTLNGPEHFDKVNLVNGKVNKKPVAHVRTFAQMREEQLDSYRNNVNRSHIGSSRSLNLSVLSQSLYGSNASFEHIMSKRRRQIREKLSMKEKTLNDPPTQEYNPTNVFKISIIESLFPKRLVTDINYNLMMLTSFLYAVSGFIPYSILPDYAIHNGVPQGESVWLISSMGIGGMISRLLFGFITDLPNMHRLSLFGGCLFVCGLSTLLVPLLKSFGLLMAYSFTFGFSYGGLYIVQPCLMLEYFGEEYIAEIFGVMMFVIGIAVFIGAPTAGWIYDATKDYNISIMFAGAIFLLAGLTNCLIVCTKPSREVRKARKSKMTLTEKEST